MSKLIRLAKANPVMFLVILCLGLRLVGVAVLDLKTSLLQVNFDAPSSGEQSQMARGLLKTGDFTYYVVDGKSTPSAYQPPLYPTFLAGVFAVAGDGRAAFVIVQIVQCFIGILTVLLAYSLARRFLPDDYALLAGFFVTIWPTFVYMPNEAHPISFLIPDILWISLLAVDLLRTGPNTKQFAHLGVAFGLGVLIRSELLAAFIVIAGSLAWKYRKQALPGIAACFLIGFAAEGLWVAHNVAAFGKPLLTTTAGLNLFRGNGPTATGGSYQWDGNIVWETPATLAAKNDLRWSPDYELKLDAVYMDALKKSLSEDPLRPFKLLPKKAFFFLTTDFTHPKGRNPAAWLAWVLLLPATFLGMRSLWKRRQDSWPLFFWVGFYFLVVLALFALPRYRMGVEPLCVIFAVEGIRVWRLGRSKLTVALAPETS